MPYLGNKFAQDIEPCGEYLSLDPDIIDVGSKYEFERGLVEFDNPLIIDFISTGHGGWKTELSKKYNGLTGEKLSEAIIKDGYDGIVTLDNGVPCEAVNLNGKRIITI